MLVYLGDNKMTANVFQYYNVIQFPDWELNYEFKTNHQNTMLNDVDETPHSTIRYLGFSDYPECKKFHVIHEAFKKTHGRLKNETISGFIEQLNFHIYFNEKEKRLFVNSPRNVSRELFKRLTNSSKNFQVVSSKIDLIKLSDDLRNNIRGGWFGNLKVADVSSVGMFGPTVGESDEWERYEQKGDLKAINVQFYGNNGNILFLITGNRSIVHYEKQSEIEILEKLISVQNILDNYTS
jgi:hypothetical protein